MPVRSRKARSTATACGPGTRYRAVSVRRPVRGSAAGRQNKYSSPSGLRPASSKKSAHRYPATVSAAGPDAPGRSRTGPLSAARAGSTRYSPSTRAIITRMMCLLLSCLPSSRSTGDTALCSPEPGSTAHASLPSPAMVCLRDGAFPACRRSSCPGLPGQAGAQGHRSSVPIPGAKPQQYRAALSSGPRHDEKKGKDAGRVPSP